MVTTENDALRQGIELLRKYTTFDGTVRLSGAESAAVMREMDKNADLCRELSDKVDSLELRNGRLKDALRTAQEGLLEMERVNNNLAADQEQHSDRDEVSAVITGQLADDLDRAEHEVYDLLTAVNFYRGLAINGTRINSVTDAAFLTALDIEL